MSNAEVGILSSPTRIAVSRIRVLATKLGQPLSKQRPRFAMSRGGHAYTPKKTQEAEEEIAWTIRIAHRALLSDSDTAFGMRLRFYQTDYQRRDLDNMVKLVADACTGLVWKDDSQVVQIDARLVRGAPEAKTEICVYTVGPFLFPTYKCVACGKNFRMYPSWRAQEKIYCSRKCRTAALRSAFMRPCVHCGALIYREPQRVRNVHEVFCSRNCLHLHRTREYTCSACGNIFRAPQSAKRLGRCFCSEQCWANYRKTHPTKFYRGVCSICGAPTSRKEYTRCAACVLESNIAARAQNPKGNETVWVEPETIKATLEGKE